MDLKEELAVKDHQLAELKEKIENHEVMDKLLEETKTRLESRVKEVQLELNQQLEKKEADYRGLQEYSTAQGQEIASLNKKQEVSFCTSLDLNPSKKHDQLTCS